MAIVELDKLSKRYAGGAINVVEEVTLTVAHGEFMVFLGPSGCGKTTTLRMIAGLESISGGRLSIDGRVVNGVPAKDRDIAMVFQSYALYPHMSVAENMAFGLRRRGMPKAEIEQRVLDAAASIGLSDLLKRRPNALSGGQRQRVALGRAIVRDPKVFLFDEPLSNLDASLRASTRLELARLHQRLGATMIYVTHDQVEAMTLGDRICVMHQGMVAQIGPPLEVYRRPANVFVARFLGSPPMNIVSTDFTIEGARILVGFGGATLSIENVSPTALLSVGPMRCVQLGVRPEDIMIVAPSTTVPRAMIQAVEHLGAETIIVASLEGGGDISIRAPRENRAVVGELIGISADPDEVHLFDNVSGNVIARVK